METQITEQTQPLIEVELSSPQATSCVCLWDRQSRTRTNAALVPTPVVSLVQLPMMGVWSEGRQYAALDWPKGAVKVAVRATCCFRPESTELARQSKRLVEYTRGLGSQVFRIQSQREGVHGPVYW
jgi:hypothetical protein